MKEAGQGLRGSRNAALAALPHLHHGPVPVGRVELHQLVRACAAGRVLQRRQRPCDAAHPNADGMAPSRTSCSWRCIAAESTVYLPSKHEH